MPDGESPRRSIDEAALLLTCLCGLPFLVPQDVDWRALLELASAHGVLLLIHQSFLRNGVEMPELFAGAVREHKKNAEKYADELARLLQQFGQRGIEVIPLKGPALAETLYSDATLRSCDDLDMLVRRQDFSNAEKALSDMGFAARAEADDYHRKFLGKDVMVELHFGVASPRSFPFDIAGVWNRSRSVTFGGQPARAMSEEDLILFLCLHGLKHGFSRLIWIMDVACALAKMRNGIEEFAQSARRQGLEQPLLIACEMVREALPQKLPSEISALIATSPEAMGKAQDAVAHLFAQRAGANNDPEIWRFYLQMESGVRQRWRRRLSFLIPTAEDYAWARRHQIHRGVVPVLRPFRLLRKYGPLRVWQILFPPGV